mmetsp:Transcript_61833/g.191458  ORF Transcript_61833/g.191458 Transcript_61833/m.191458 type:complete len:265 (-) Transcript_61833:1027-1821(-)
MPAHACLARTAHPLQPVRVQEAALPEEPRHEFLVVDGAVAIGVRRSHQPAHSLAGHARVQLLQNLQQLALRDEAVSVLVPALEGRLDALQVSAARPAVHVAAALADPDGLSDDTGTAERVAAVVVRPEILDPLPVSRGRRTPLPSARQLNGALQQPDKLIVAQGPLFGAVEKGKEPSGLLLGDLVPCAFDLVPEGHARPFERMQELLEGNLPVVVEVHALEHLLHGGTALEEGVPQLRAQPQLLVLQVVNTLLPDELPQLLRWP